MDWPKFDFAKRSYVQRSQRLSNVKKSNFGTKKSHPKVCRSVVTDFENVKPGKKESSTRKNTAGRESTRALYQQVLPSNRSPTYLQGDSSQMKEKVKRERIPPLSPILINGFLKNPKACSTEPLEEANTSSTNLVAASISHCEGPHSKQMLLSGETRGTSFSNQSQLGKAFATTEQSDNCSLKCGGNSNCSLKLHASPLIAATSVHSLNSSQMSLETLPPSQVDCEDVNENESFPKLGFISSQLSLESDESITMRHAPSDSDVFQTHTGCVDEPESVTTGSEQSRDCFLDVTIHDIEPAYETELFPQNTLLSVGNELTVYDLQKESSETAHQKQSHRLSKLAETLKKRLFISSSDLAMWKCEEPKQHPIRQITVTSSVQQWGFCWTLARSVGDLEVAHIVDSEPMKKTVHMTTSGEGVGKTKGESDDEGSSSDAIFALYQPLSKLSTSSGEFILSPRYYR
ncbi:unnamed protein product [Litomosoides sigmodontis]|uniref:Uncharacterized protein n=1 Tax=Litomosoides sigmodontis TaxID=42156 RepID=A0A3P6SI43_LITSI|nr:unnamed protein product [Litomosoides sigmodontis]